MENFTAEGLLRPREAAAWLKISERKLWGLERRGNIRSVRFGGSVRYDLADLMAFAESCKTKVVTVVQASN